jgi:cytochrome c oxidase subunit 2
MIAQISLWTPAASTVANRVDQVFLVLFCICFGVGILVACLLFGFSIHFRRRSGDRGNPPATHQSRLLEWFWTLSPLVIFIGMYIWGGSVYYAAYSPPPNAMPLYVVAKQWMWKFQHPEGQREIATLHVPAGQPVQLVLISEDVIHSFFVPAFRLHMDVLPGRYTSTWFEATRPGTYHLFCSQYCGTDHAGMVGQVIVMPPAEYEAWLAHKADGSLALQGRQVVLKYRCLSCHSSRATARAPDLERIAGARVPLRSEGTVTADDSYIRESILRPSEKIVAGYQDVMPSFAGQISEEEIIAVITYLRMLEDGQTPDRVEDFPPPVTTPPINSTDAQP